MLNYIVGDSLEAGSVYGLMALVRDGGECDEGWATFYLQSYCPFKLLKV